MKTEYKKFSPYERVLIRDCEDKWQIDFYSHWNEECSNHIVMAYGNGLELEDSDIIPYEGNEHLLGTTDDPEEEIKLENGELIVCFDNIERFNGMNIELRIFEGITNDAFITNHCHWVYAIRFSDFNPSDMEETRKHILCVRDGKVVRYKK